MDHQANHDMFIAPERKTSTITGTGVQYIPGHTDPFVDHILNSYLKDSEKTVDLGGGGLRFAIPTALVKKFVTVVDLDSTALDVDLIVERVNKVGKLKLDANSMRPFLTTVKSDVISFLKKGCTYDLITSFRFVHFLDPNQLMQFFEFSSCRLLSGGRLAISGLAVEKNSSEENPIYELTIPVSKDNSMYRKWKGGSQSEKVQKEQNLGPYVHFLNEDYIQSYAEKFGYKILESDLYSTNVVRGYVLEKS